MKIKCNRCRVFRTEDKFKRNGIAYLSCEDCAAKEREYQRKKYLHTEKPINNHYWQSRNHGLYEPAEQIETCPCGNTIHPARSDRAPVVRCTICWARAIEASLASRSADRPGREPCLSVSSLNFPPAVSDGRGGIFPKGAAVSS